MWKAIRRLDNFLRDFFSGKPLGLKPRHWTPLLAGAMLVVLAFSVLENPVIGRFAFVMLLPGAYLADLGGWGMHDSAGFLCYTAGNMFIYAALAAVLWHVLISRHSGRSREIVK